MVRGIEIALSMDKGASPAKAKQSKRWEGPDAPRYLRWEASEVPHNGTSERQPHGDIGFPTNLTEAQTSPIPQATTRCFCCERDGKPSRVIINHEVEEVNAVIDELKEGMSSEDLRDNYKGGEMGDVKKDVAAIFVSSEEDES